MIARAWMVPKEQRRSRLDLTVMVRTNNCREYIQHLAGSCLRPELHKTLPLSHRIVEIRFGGAPTQATIRRVSSNFNLSHRFDRNHREDDVEHCGMTQFRSCVFHMSSRVASKTPALLHEAMGATLADCLHYQVDLIAGDANMAAYRIGGSRQGSTSVRDSCFQEMVCYYLRAYMGAHQGDPYCCPKARLVSANPAQVDGRKVRRFLQGCGCYGLGKFQALTVW